MRFPGNSLSVRRMVLLTSLAFCALASGMQSSAAPPSDAEITSILRRYIECDHWGVGIVVGIVDEQGTRVVSYGRMDNGASPEVSGDTLFEIGSITKTFTTLLLEDMIQRGEMRLDDPVERFLPGSYEAPYDPAPGVSKRLRVRFRLAGETRAAEAGEGEALELPDGAEVIEAAYGDLASRERTADVSRRVAALLRSGASSIRADNSLPVHSGALRVPAWGARKLTLRDLATHRSGLPRDLGDNTVAGLYDLLTHCRLPRRPGCKVAYSNVGLQLLGQAIASKAGTNYEALLQERICRPLGLSSTSTLPSAEQRARLAKSHSQENRLAGDLADVLAPLPGSGAIRSSVGDMLKYAAANLGLQNTPLLPLMERTHVVQVPHGFGDADVGLPWCIHHRQGSELITHGGGTLGQTAFLGFDKQARRGVVVLANRDDGLGQAVLHLGLYLLHPPRERLVLPGAAPRGLDSFVGLYEFRDLPQGILAIRREGGGLVSQFLNCAAVGEWVPVTDRCFVWSWDPEARMELHRSILGGTSAVFTSPSGGSRRARKISAVVPESLFAPMLQPLAAGECAPRKGSDLAGAWKVTAGAWYWPFQALHGELRIAEPSHGVFRAEFDFPEQNANHQPISVIYHPPGVELVARSGAGMFKGKINTGHTRMTGRFYQGHYSVGATLRRIGAEREATGIGG